MIKIRLKFGEGQEPKDIEIVEGELLSAAVERALSDVPPIEGKELKDIFQVVVNGLCIEPDFWPVTQLKAQDEVIISPSMLSGDSGALFKQAAIIAIAAVASVVLTPAGGATVLSALSVAAVTIGATLLLNALIPPPVPEALSTPGGIESSQMYSITGQSNSAKRFETVPKVYGTHRIFPNVAALPYTELATDPVTGELVQYLYCIYDFGLGPAYVSNLAIGDTPLNGNNFSDYEVNFVDLNRPDVSEGIWDDYLKSDFSLYKGDQEGDNVASEINGNQTAGDAQVLWELNRTSADNPDNQQQELILNFVAPKGIYWIQPNGEQVAVRITMSIEFSKVGEDNWKRYNDPEACTAWSAVGGQTADVVIPYIPGPNPSFESGYYVAFEGNRGEGSAIYKDLPINYRSGRFREIHYRPGLSYISIIPPETIFGSIFYRSQYLGMSALFLGILLPEDNNYYQTYLQNPDGSLRTLPAGLLAFLYYYDDTTSSWVLVDNVAAKNMYSSANINDGTAVIVANNSSPTYATFRFTPRETGQFKVRVRRVSTYQYGGFINGAPAIRKETDLTWSTLTTRIARPPIITDKRHVFMEIRIRATGQLNGNIQNLSGIVRSVHDIYDSGTETWAKDFTSNPAWIFTSMLTGQENKRPVDRSRLHLESISEWADFCDQVPTPPPAKTYEDPRFTTNMVLDYNVSLQELLGQVTNAAQASLNIIDGKYGVLIDKFRSTPVQIFTPRNSKDFTSQRFYANKPKAVSVKYIDPSRNWETQEVVVYDDGYNFDNTTDDDTEQLTAFACTSQEQAWRFGRYMMAQNKLRQETMTITVDFEHLVCTRGDYVQITQDVMRVGGTPARVKSILSNVVTINDAIDIDTDLDYGYVARKSDGTIITSTLTPVSAREFALDGIIPQVGDLIVIGEVNKIVYDCLVKSISPNEDLSATLVLIEKADAVYDYESSGDLPDYDPSISTTSNPDFAPPRAVQDLVVADSGYDCALTGNSYEYFVDLAWDAPPGSTYEFFAIYVNYGRGYLQVDQTSSSIYHYVLDEDNLGLEHSFKVIAVSASGRKLPVGAVDAVTATVNAKTAPPSDIPKLSSDITNEVLQLTWEPIDDCDVRRYLIRYTPVVSNADWNASTPLFEADSRATTASVQARTGSYLIKAIDFAGNESVNAALAVTTIPSLTNLNIIDEITDSPTFTGSFDRVEKLGTDSIILSVSSGTVRYSEGYYYYVSLLDLGEIYTVRLQSLIQAEGYTSSDIMSDWVTLDSVLLLASAKFSEWDVETQYRSSDQFNVMANWLALSDIAFLNEGDAEAFTEWRKFSIGDATGRVFQFRLRLISNKPTVTPRIFDATIRADMPDRIESYQNLTVDAVNGYTVTYAPAFKGPGTTPNIQVSIDGAESGDYWAFDYKTLEGFKIRVYDKTDTQVERTIDVMVRGYGRQHTVVI